MVLRLTAETGIVPPARHGRDGDEQFTIAVWPGIGK
jgi:hypothetical protein